LKQIPKLILNGFLALIMLVVAGFLFVFSYRLDFVLNVYFGLFYLLYCVLIVGIFVFLICKIIKYKNSKLWLVIVFLPFAILTFMVVVRIYSSVGASISSPTVIKSHGSTPFFDQTDPNKIDFWHYIWTGELK